MYYIIFTIVLVLAAAVLKYKASKSGYPKTDSLLVVIIGVFWYYYLIDYIVNFEGIELDRTILCISYMVSNLLVPLGYIYVCLHCNIKVFSYTTIGIFLLILFNIVTSGSAVLDWYSVDSYDNSPGIHLYRKGRELICMKTFQFVEFFQLIWISVRAFVLWKKSQVEGYKPTNKGIVVFVAIFVTLIYLMLCKFITGGLVDNKGLLLVVYTVHLIIAIVLMYLVFHGYLQDVIIDENEEVAYIETRPKFAEMKARMDKLMVDNKLFLDKDLSLEEMTSMLKTNRTYLSQMIRESYGTSFTGYVNYMRIEEAKRLMKEDPTAKMEDIALLCGFSSASSFTRTFKSITGITPRVWR